VEIEVFDRWAFVIGTYALALTPKP
jgi:hypothetical protein